MNMMTIFDHLRKFNGKLRRWEDGDFGVEIETETTKNYEIPKFSFWDVHQDGSLRGVGIEYVLMRPLSYDKELPLALKEFKEKTKDIKFNKDSVTTSVHTHINFLNDTWLTLCNFLTAYTLTENLLIRFSGENRRSNLFCLPMCDSEDVYENIMDMVEFIRKGAFARLSLSEEYTKYGAINIGALMKYGSMEIRSFRGTTDTDEIMRWCSILWMLKQYSKTPGLNPKIIVESYRTKGSDILDDIFKEYRRDIKHIDEENLLEKNFWYAANIGYSTKDWNALDSEVKKKKNSKDLDSLSMASFGNPFNVLSASQQRAILNVRDNGRNETQGFRIEEQLTPIMETAARTFDEAVRRVRTNTSAPAPARRDDRGVIVYNMESDEEPRTFRDREEAENWLFSRVNRNDYHIEELETPEDNF